jgi:hypothetical protein
MGCRRYLKISKSRITDLDTWNFDDITIQFLDAVWVRLDADDYTSFPAIEAGQDTNDMNPISNFKAVSNYAPPSPDRNLS